MWHGFVGLRGIQISIMITLFNRQRSAKSHFQVAPGVWGMKDIMVNIYMILNQYDGTWVLIDAGLKTSKLKIKRMAEQLFGLNTRPSCIILTHAHFDHVGSLAALAEEWNVPVYAHEKELPYLTGVSAYPPPDSTVGGGLLASIAWVYPNEPIDISGRVLALPKEDLPGLPGWRYIETPGHSPGHISLFRENDRVLIAGDAFITTKQESLFSVMFQKKIISGPPKYFTYDWGLARQSVDKLVDVNPEVAATGHGVPIEGRELREGLIGLSEFFREIAVPTTGRYVDTPARANITGVTYVPPKKPDTRMEKLASLAALTAVSAAFIYLNARRNHRRLQDVLAYEIQ
jgi:glyoxylase-like metal-dependent hydrolase (beta-lactamase superfamily II)